MAKRLGLVDSLDFGAGAYYYADIPEFERFVKENSFTTGVSSVVIIIVFIIWGLIIYKLWCWLEDKIN